MAETIIVTAERMPTVKTVAGAEKNANTAESGISGGIETTTERIIRVETTNVENKNGVTIHSHERLDELHRNGYWIIQDPGRFCFWHGCSAAVRLFAKVKPGERALDLGTGTDHTTPAGGKDPRGTFYRAGNSAGEGRYGGAKRRLQSFGRKITIVTGDIKGGFCAFRAGSFEVITTNAV